MYKKIRQTEKKLYVSYVKIQKGCVISRNPNFVLKTNLISFHIKRQILARKVRFSK